MEKSGGVIKVLGRKICYKSLFSRLQILRKVDQLQLLDIENEFFLVKFNSDEGYYRELSEGPWTLMGSYILTQPWSPSFDVDKDSIYHVALWIRLPGCLCINITKNFLKELVLLSAMP